MNAFFKIISGLSLLVSFSARAANPPQPSDFAFGISLTPDASNAVNRIDLPLSFYQGVTKSDLSDARVFNADGSVVPHEIERALPTTIKPKSIDLPVFELGDNALDPARDFGLSIEVEANGAVARVKTDSPDNAESKEIKAYLIDASGVMGAFDSMTFSWADGTAAFVRDVTIESSNDLYSWNLLARTTLAEAHVGDHTIIENDAIFAPVRTKYLRVTWPGQNALPPLNAVWVTPVTHTAAREFVFSPATRLPGNEKEFLFDTGGFIPVASLRFTLPSANTLVNVIVSSAMSKDGPWTERFQEQLYRITVDGQELVTPDIALSPTPDRYWKLSVNQKEGGLEPSSPPSLNLGWRPHRLYFLTQGKAPFILAFGSATIASVAFNLKNLLPKSGDPDTQIPNATLGERGSLGGESKLLPPAPLPPYRKWALWAALVVGVIVLGVMARSVAKNS